MQYRVFVQDVGRSGYSGLRDVDALTPAEAVRQAIKKWGDPGRRLIALPHTRRDLWPHKTTGRVPEAALEIQAIR